MKNDVKQQRIAGALSVAPGPLGATIYGSAKARKGRKVAVSARVVGRSVLEGNLAGLAGGMATKGPKGAYLGAALGGFHGGSRAFRNAQKRGDIKKSSGFVSAWGIEH